NGSGHNGIDLGVPIGTAIKSAGVGEVVASGDTDTVCPRASYGKWVLIKHSNGLSTLYAHLSLIKVSAGQAVESGSIIGYSGNTGYSTGPHLHFTVYASQGVQVVNRPSQACGGTYTMPVADLKAYLNPLSYL
ncbi:MAG: M23 family metallopeptidase, partial [bacterium]|nr:M23 family metallopeptidase [bacterium]